MFVNRFLRDPWVSIREKSHSRDCIIAGNNDDLAECFPYENAPLASVLALGRVEVKG